MAQRRQARAVRPHHGLDASQTRSQSTTVGALARAVPRLRRGIAGIPLGQLLGNYEHQLLLIRIELFRAPDRATLSAHIHQLLA